jgi:BirA family transcriptional regulator, biotin operon repressor / biotin---[acetyl-CoA-carboxylase] ligase
VITVLSKPQLVKEIEFRPLDVAAVEAGLRRSGTAWSIRHLPECSSTQDLAAAAARRGEAAGLVLSTDFQRSGRGRRGGSWQAPRASALLVSILLQPRPPLLPLTPLLAGIAVVDGIRAACGLGVELEWPNDVVVQARKLAGILVEHPPGPLALVGVGVNVAAAPTGLEPGAAATAVARELGRPVAREPLLASILNALASVLERAGESGPGWVRLSWLARSSMIGHRLAFEEGDRQGTGIAEDLLEDGALLVRLDDSSHRRLVAGAVRHVRPKPPQS